MLSESVRLHVEKSIVECGYTVPENLVVEHPHEPFGDFATNAALLIAKSIGKDPLEVAEKISQKLKSLKLREIEDVSVAKPGFINIVLSNTILDFYVNKAISKDFGRSEMLKGKKIIVEYTDPNPFKVFHMGHLMPNVIGESFSRVVEYLGAKVIRVNYQGDVGIHVASAVWSLLREKPSNLDNKVLGQMYAKGVSAYKNDKKSRKEIEVINKKIYEGGDEEINSWYKKGREISLKHFEIIYKRLGTKFDDYFFESQTGKIGLKKIEENKDIFENDDDALIFRGEKFNLHTRVFINSAGLPTYEAKELGLLFLKEEKYNPDLSFTVTANEKKEYMRVLDKVIEIISPEIRAKTEHIFNGIMKFSSGKMSSRTGNVVSAEDFLDNIKNEVKNKSSKNSDEKNFDFIAVCAAKYAILKQSASKDIIFDVNKEISFEGDSGPYIQYSLVRAKSILKKENKISKLLSITNKNVYDYKPLKRIIYQFEEEVIRAYKDRSSHGIAKYLLELSSTFNTWYVSEKILGSDNEKEKLRLVRSVSNTIENGLDLLGIKSVENM